MRKPERVGARQGRADFQQKITPDRISPPPQRNKTLKKFYLVNKREGETPLEALETFRRLKLKRENIKLTYAGRLDPMAEGLLLILAGEETKNKEKYLGLEKEYEFQVLFGFATDTHDILGKVAKAGDTKIEKAKLKELIENNLKFFKGKRLQKYPKYSSPNIRKVLKEEEAEAKEREVFIKSLKLIKISKISKARLQADIEKRIKKVRGDFRQDEILATWNKYFRTSMLKEYYIASFKIKCSSGTYVRAIADSLGKKIKIPALAYKISRTRVGAYVLK